jgi:hypothetical protein
MDNPEKLATMARRKKKHTTNTYWRPLYANKHIKRK